MKQHDFDDLHESVTCMMQFDLQKAMFYDLINLTLDNNSFTNFIPYLYYSSFSFLQAIALLVDSSANPRRILSGMGVAPQVQDALLRQLKERKKRIAESS